MGQSDKTQQYAEKPSQKPSLPALKGVFVISSNLAIAAPEGAQRNWKGGQEKPWKATSNARGILPWDGGEAFPTFLCLYICPNVLEQTCRLVCLARKPFTQMKEKYLVLYFYVCGNNRGDLYTVRFACLICHPTTWLAQRPGQK